MEIDLQIAPGLVAPAVPTRRVDELTDIETRLRAAHTARVATSHSSAPPGVLQ
jgi:hypothetical protein